jgi:hypothetical protein
MVKTIEDAERLVTKVETLKQQQQIQEEKMSILEESSHQLDCSFDKSDLFVIDNIF